MRLFMLRNGKGGKPVADQKGNIIFFSNKMLAKEARKKGHVVSKGIDHKKYIDRGEIE